MMVIYNGVVVDGSRGDPFKGYVVINKDRIEFIGEGVCPLENYENYELIDARSNIISPGFIDIHTHSDITPFVYENPDCKVLQGVTLEVTGNCGITTFPSKEENIKEITNYFNSLLEIKYNKEKFDWYDCKEYLSFLSQKRLIMNFATFVGHCTLRADVVGFEDVKANKDQLEEMCKILDTELENGAVGLSLGLIYPTGIFSDLDELIELAKVVKKHNKLISVHMRSESTYLFEAVDEMLNVASATGVKIQISHLKLIGREQWGKADMLLRKIENARKNGLNIYCDQYPYHASSTALSALTPKWSKSGGTKELLNNLKIFSNKIQEDIKNEMHTRGGPDNIMLNNSNGVYHELEGKTISEISIIFGLEPLETVVKLLIDTNCSSKAIYFSMNKEDVLKIMKQNYISVGSDGYALPIDKSILESGFHPRSFGTFPRFFKLVRENKLMDLKDAIYKASTLNALILGIKDRGYLKPGYFADITVFDFDKIKDNSTFEEPINSPDGISYVIVNGSLIVNDGKLTDNRNGTIVS